MSDDDVLSSLTAAQLKQFKKLSGKRREVFLRKAAELAKTPPVQDPVRPYVRRLVTAFGETKTLTEWAADKRCAVERNVLYKRVFHSGWNAEQAIVTPLQPDIYTNLPPVGGTLPRDRGGPA